MFAREGYPLIAGAVVLGVLLLLIGFWFNQVGWIPSPWHFLFGGLALLVIGFTLYFFRDPDRTPPLNSEQLILAPADGKVVVIQEVEEPVYIKGPARQVSIFLSPLNVHVNRIPADGQIEYVEYVPGEYLVAWHEKASDLNERSMIGLRHPGGIPVFFKQIAGMVARRIVYHVREGDTVRAGARFGLVKFGSRMDVLVPLEVDIRVQLGDKVTAGESILGYLPISETPASVPADTTSSLSQTSPQ